MHFLVRLLTAAALLIFCAPAKAADCTTLGNTVAPCGVVQDDAVDHSDITLGVPGVFAGTVKFSGATSGTVTVTPQAVAGTGVTVTLPNTSGTIAANASSPLVLSSVTGTLTCPTCVTSSTGGAITGTAPISVSAAGVVSLATPLALNYGGTNASLTASNGGIVYSTASAFAILNGTATANQMLLSGASGAPSWSTATWPATAAQGQILNTSAANVWGATATPTLGVPGSVTGSLGFAGNVSGTVTLIPQSTAGTVTLTLPNTSGTIAVSASAPLNLSATTGALSLPTPLALTYGGTNASLTASNGGIVWSNASQLQILSGTATANQLLLSGASGSPAWSTATYPATAAQGAVLNASAANVVAATVTPVLGNPGASTGTLGFAGLTSGTVTITPQSVAGTPTLTLPNASGTLASSASAPLSLNATSGALSLGIVPLSLGGTNANLVASNGGIVWSNASQFQILAGTATANQMLLSGLSGAPSWSTATWPATTAANQILYSSANNTVTGLATANNGALITNGTGVPSIGPIPNSNLATMAPNTVKGSIAGGTPSDLTVTQSQALLGSALVPHVSNNTSLKALTGGSVPIVIRDGYTTAGDGGAARYTWSASNCSLAAGAGDNGSQVQPGAGGGCWIADFTQSGNIDIRVWGAFPNQGSSIDNGPSIRAACAYSETANVKLSAIAGAYYLNTLDSSGLGAIVYGNTKTLTSGCSVEGYASTNYPDTGESTYAASGLDPTFILGAALNRPLLYIGQRAGNSLWKNIDLDGNRGAQTGWAGGPSGKLYVVQISDTLYWAVNTAYATGSFVINSGNLYLATTGGISAASGGGPTGTLATITDGTVTWTYAGPNNESAIQSDRVVIRGGYNGGLYNGSSRGILFMRDTWILYNGQTTSDSALYLNGYDATLNNIQIGVNSGIGITIAEGSQYEITDGSVFLNGAAGMIVAGGQVQYLNVKGTNFQWNATNGISITNAAPFAGTAAGIHSYSDITFDGNSYSSTHTYSDVLINGSSIERFTNPNFMGSASQAGGTGPGSIPNYNIEFSACGFAAVLNPSFGTGTSSFSGFSNHSECIQTNANITNTWVPVLAGSTTAGTPTYSARSGTWFRNGNEITVHFMVQVSALGGPTGNMSITGLPRYSSATANELGTCAFNYYSGWTADTGFTALVGLVANNGNTIQLYEIGSGKTAQSTPVSNYAAATQLQGVCHYHTDN